mgnify:CR=1 FL=1
MTGLKILSLNPCYTGSYAAGIKGYSYVDQRSGVLILVILEVTLLDCFRRH